MTTDDEFRDDELVRMAAVVMDPTYGRPVPPTRRSSADLIAIAHRQRRASVARTVALAVVPPVLVLAAAAGFAAGRPPVAAVAPPEATRTEATRVVLPPPTPLAVAGRTRPGSAGPRLAAVATRMHDVADPLAAGAYTFVYTRVWTRDPTGRSAAEYRDERLWWSADRSGRRSVTNLATASPAARVVEYAPGGLDVPIEEPSPVVPVLASQLTTYRPFGDGPQAALRAVVDLYRFHALDAAQRAATLQVLADTAGLGYLGTVVDRGGRAGLAVSADSEAGAVREVAVFDPATGHLLSYERLDRSGDAWQLAEFVVFLAARHTHHAE
ncbi:hypothetical protein WEI85_47090 [Actinomycetes bacterium KLBMP 9797]